MIVVTGATGTVGSKVVRQLAEKGKQVRAVVRNVDKAKDLFATNIDVVRGDLGDPGSLTTALKGATELFLLSPTSLDQVQNEANAIEAAKSSGVRHIVKLSVIGAAADAATGIARWHAAIEDKARQSGLPWTFVRPTYFMDNLRNFADTIKQDGAFYAPMRDGRLTMIDARDIAAVSVEALTSDRHSGKIYELTGPQAVSYDDVAATLTKLLGRPIKYVNVPPETARTNMLKTGMPDWYVADLITMTSYFAGGGGAGVSSTVREVTGRPGRTLADWAQKNLSLFKR